MKNFVRLAIKFLLLFILIYSKTNAQSPATGCLLTDNRVYRNVWSGGGITPNYWYDTAVYNSLPPNTCRWNPTSSTRACSTCSAFSYNPSTGSYVCSGSQQVGVYASYSATAIGCSLDNYIWFLMILLAVPTFYILRQDQYFPNTLS